MCERCVIYISSTNYKLVSAGTEKFMAGLIGAFERENIHSIQIFPLVNVNEKLGRMGLSFSYIGVNFDGMFIGVYLLKDCLSAISYICEKYNVQCESIIINQLHNWDLKILADTINFMKLPVFIVVHDYMMVCSHIMKADGQAIRCGLNIKRPSNIHCYDCKYSEHSQKQFIKLNDFMVDIKKLVDKVIFPSFSAQMNWLKVFPYFSEVSMIRPHLNYRLTVEEKNQKKKIRIAYLGYISDLKGYSEWKRIMHHLNHNRFEFYYFGSAVEQAERDGAKAVLVDFNKKNTPGMVQQLNEHEIDIAFLWSNCLETYSYTYYEATEAGCWIITSSHSGNITDQVTLNGNGKVFENIKDCIGHLKQLKNVNSAVKITEVTINNNIQDFVPSRIIGGVSKSQKSKKPSYVVSQLYKRLRGSEIEGKN